MWGSCGIGAPWRAAGSPPGRRPLSTPGYWGCVHPAPWKTAEAQPETHLERGRDGRKGQSWAVGLCALEGGGRIPWTAQDSPGSDPMAHVWKIRSHPVCPKPSQAGRAHFMGCRLVTTTRTTRLTMTKAALTGREGLAREICPTASQGHTPPRRLASRPPGVHGLRPDPSPHQIKSPQRAEARLLFRCISRSPQLRGLV